jgi:multidrug efflux pump subunit AcrA (membrane-fusion protein)
MSDVASAREARTAPAGTTRPSPHPPTVSMQATSTPAPDAAEPAPPRRAASALSELVRIEGEMRTLTSVAELDLHLVNEIAAVVPCDQALVFRASPVARGRSPRWRLTAAGSLASVAADAPLVRWLEALAVRVHGHAHSTNEAGSGAGAAGADKPRAFVVAEHADPDDPDAAQMALGHGLWLPMPDALGRPSAAAMLLASEPCAPAQGIVAGRVTAAYAHAQLALAGRRARQGWVDALRARRWTIASSLAVVGGAALAFVNVPLTTLAPVEVAPAEPFVVAAPVPGVVERMLVQPGATVKAGEPLVQLVDTSLRNDFDVAEQRLAVARARTLRVQQAVVDDPVARRELVIAQTEQGVAQAERDFAGAMLRKAVLAAPIDGVALFGDARDWMGRPVAVGEAILRVADASKTEFQLRVPVADAVNVRVGLPVQVFLDADPLVAHRARITRVAYKADADATGLTAFLVTAVLEGSDGIEGAAAHTVPQLGLRGTAQVRGDEVSLFYYLLRRPITALRQTLGV